MRIAYESAWVPFCHVLPRTGIGWAVQPGAALVSRTHENRLPVLRGRVRRAREPAGAGPDGSLRPMHDGLGTARRRTGPAAGTRAAAARGAPSPTGAGPAHAGVGASEPRAASLRGIGAPRTGTGARERWQGARGGMAVELHHLGRGRLGRLRPARRGDA